MWSEPAIEDDMEVDRMGEGIVDDWADTDAVGWHQFTLGATVGAYGQH